MQADWEGQTDLGAKMDSYFTLVPLVWFDTITQAPDAAEMIDGMNKVAKAEIDEAMAEWAQLFGDLFADAGYADPAGMADFFISSSKTAKLDVPDRATLVRRLEMLKMAVLALGPAQG